MLVYIEVVVTPVPVRHKDWNRWDLYFSLTNIESKWHLVHRWCWDTFGHPGTNPETGVKSDWDYHGGYIYFYNEKYVTMYILRWS